MHILVTGGAGYIGSHTVIELLESGHEVEIVDNLVNGEQETISQVKEISGMDIPFHEIDARNTEELIELVSKSSFDAVIHFAGLKAIGESVSDPLRYYSNNVGSTLSVLKAMQFAGIPRLIFSSSATVYGSPVELPVKETAPVGSNLTNPYGRTKFMSEEIITDLTALDSNFEASILRYFNPVGRHPSGLIGGRLLRKPDNLAPFIAGVAAEKYPYVEVFGNDYDTLDGTGVRDYIHVSDLARGHLAALENSRPGLHTYNLGTGKGTSVLELINIFGDVTGKVIPYKIANRRQGDVAESFADVTKARNELHWIAKKSVADACEDEWRWQSRRRS